MKIVTAEQNGVTVLHLQGDLDADTVAQFKKESYRLVESGCHRLVMDCRTLDFIDSMGLGAMISLLRRVRTHDGDVKVAGLSKDVYSVFEITRLHRLFEILPDWQTAAAKFGS